MIILQTTASGFDSAAAAVQAGADELLLRLWDDAPGASMTDTIKYCRKRSVKTVLDLTGRMTDDQIAEAAVKLAKLYTRGLDAALVSDRGALRMVRMTAPDIELHVAGGIHNLSGARDAEEAGARRAVLAPGLPMDSILYICRNSPIEIQVAAYGRECPMSGGFPCFLGGQDGGTCKLACRRRYGYDGKADETPLEPRLIDMLSELPALDAAGVAAVGIAGNNDVVLPANGVLSGNGDRRPPDAALLGRVRKLLSGGDDIGANPAERQRVPVRFYCLIESGEPVRLAVNDDRGHTEVISGPLPIRSDTELLDVEVNTQLYKTAGTPYRCEEARTRLRPGLNISLSALRNMKRDLLLKLDETRTAPPKRDAGRYHSGVKLLPRKEPPEITVQLSSVRQLSGELISMRPACIYLPLPDLCRNPEKTSALCRSGITVVAVMPRVIYDGESGEVLEKLSAARGLGVSQALVYHPGHAELAVSAGYSVRGEFHCANSQALKEYKQKGYLSVMLTMGLELGKIKEISHSIDTELTVYGRMPLLLSERCLIKTPAGLCRCDGTVELVDEEGQRCPMVRESGHRSLVYGAGKLWMAPHRRLWSGIGLWAGRLVFTTENNREVVQVTERFLGEGRYVPNRATAGFYIQEEASQGKRAPVKNLFF